MSLSERTAEFISRHGLPAPAEGRIAVALSGGADSVALLSLLKRLGYDCVAFHCNFHLRGQESNRDQRHAEAIAARLRTEIVTKDFDVAARCGATGESVEMACRALRYEWFDEAADLFGCRYIAVGHHAEDNVETLLLNLLRGTGIKGLTGMRPRRGRIVRPLLDATKKEILDYLAAEGLDYVTDSSNLSNDYKRNRLRNIIIPALERDCPGATDGILRSMRHLESDALLLSAEIERLKGEYVDRDGRIDMRHLRESAPYPAETLYHLTGGAFVEGEVRRILTASSGSVFTSRRGDKWLVDHDTLRLYVDRSPSEEIVVDPAHPELLPEGFEMAAIGPDEFMADPTGATVYIDLDAIPADRCLTLRRWRNADRLEPFGMKGSRLVSDIFSDAKWGVDQKARAWLLTDGDKVLWVAGLRASRHYPVGSTSKRILRLHIFSYLCS